MKPIPASTSTFGDLIEGDFVYADKTAAIRELVRPAFAQYILARPRRFGKAAVLVDGYDKPMLHRRRTPHGGLVEGRSCWSVRPSSHQAMEDYAGRERT